MLDLLCLTAKEGDISTSELGCRKTQGINIGLNEFKGQRSRSFPRAGVACDTILLNVKNVILHAQLYSDFRSHNSQKIGQSSPSKL